MANSQSYIVGHGRSGTNWLLKLLNCHPLIHGKNEPSEIPSSPFNKLPSPDVLPTNTIMFKSEWESCLEWSRNHFITLDPLFPPIKKNYIYSLPFNLGFQNLMFKKKFRNIFSPFKPDFRNEYWTIPSWLGNEEEMRKNILLLKFVQTPGWARYLLRQNDGSTIIHIVRHPGGYLNSWKNRYYSNSNNEKVLSESRSRLKFVAEHDKQWAETFPEIDSLSVEETELWYWLYSSMSIHEAGRTSNDNYIFINYEELCKSPLDIISMVFERLNLDMSQEIQDHVLKNSTESMNISSSWVSKLNDSDKKLVNSFYERSKDDLNLTTNDV